jgi:hypothetical protein
MERSGTVPLAAPFLLDSVPCSALPPVVFGVARPPTMLVDGYTPVGDATGPFGAIPDLFVLHRLSIADSRNPEFPVRIYDLRLQRGESVLDAVTTRS